MTLKCRWLRLVALLLCVRWLKTTQGRSHVAQEVVSSLATRRKKATSYCSWSCALSLHSRMSAWTPGSRRSLVCISTFVWHVCARQFCSALKTRVLWLFGLKGTVVVATLWLRLGEFCCQSVRRSIRKAAMSPRSCHQSKPFTWRSVQPVLYDWLNSFVALCL